MMNDRDYAQLNEYIDGELNDADRREFEERLAGDSELQAELDALRNLLHEAQRLPKSMQPERELWHDIESRLDEPVGSSPGGVVRFRRSRNRSRKAASANSPWPLVIAAGVVFALFLGVQYFSSTPVDAPETIHRISAVPEGSPVDPLIEAVDLEYAEARAELVRLLEARRANLPEDTLAVVEENLGIIENAVIDINRALEEYPEDPKLRGMLHQAYRQEMDVLQQAVQLPDDNG